MFGSINLTSQFALFVLILSATPLHRALGQEPNSAPYSSLKTLKGFEPTVLASEDQALSLYKSQDLDFRRGSGCFQRAHIWAKAFSDQKQIRSMKVFLFFTRRYQREFDYKWFYHVAPLIPVRLTDGSIQEQVFDPTFTSGRDTETTKYANKPVSITHWVAHFMYPKVDCPVIENYEDYQKYADREYCFIMKSPMYTYIPAQLQNETQVRTAWNEFDLKNMVRAKPWF